MAKLLPIFLALILSASLQSQQLIPGEYIIQLEQGSNLESFQLQRNPIRFDNYKIICPSLNVFWFKLSEDDEKTAVSILKKNPNVIHLAQNRYVQQRNDPDDEHFDKQWNLMKIDIQKAWNVTTGGKTPDGEEIVVAVLDSGYKTNLSDLKDNVAVNFDERFGDSNSDGCPGDCGVDDDGDGLIDEDGFNRTPSHPLYDFRYADDDDENGYKDDINGLNLRDYTDIHPESNHGTAVAGIIGAKGNNGHSVAGINWDIKMLLLSQVSQYAKIIEAYNYVYEKRKLYNRTNGEKGLFIVANNFSSGIDKEFGTDFPIWCGLYDLLGEEGVLSVGATTNKDVNVDEEGDMPTTCTSKYLIAVTNTTEIDDKASSGYGALSIDLGAPGNRSITLEIGEIDNVGEFSGTSAAAPHVAGAIGLLYSVPCQAFVDYFRDNPSEVYKIKDYILNSTDKVSSLENITVSGGRLNVYNAMKELQVFCPTTTGELNIDNVFPNPSYRENIHIKYTSPDDSDEYDLLIFNSIGHLVYKETINAPLFGAKEYVIEMPELSSGTYIIVLRNEGNITSYKHVIIPN